MMDEALGELIDNGILVYLDDILVYAENEEKIQELFEKCLLNSTRRASIWKLQNALLEWLR